MGSFAMSSREIERGMAFCKLARGAGFIEPWIQKSVHSDRLARPSDVIDKRPGVCTGDLRHPVEGAGENGARLFTGDIAAGEHKRPHLRGLQGEAFQLAIAYTLVARQHDSAVPAGFGEPDLV